MQVNYKLDSNGVGNAYVVDVWTLSKYRNMGVARKMMELLLKDLQGQHVPANR